MNNQLIMMVHATTGVLAMLGAVWLFVATLSTAGSNSVSIRASAMFASVCMWLTYIIGGYWYVAFYGAEKAIIKSGPFPEAHGFFMETKEHVFLLLLLLATWLPIAVFRAQPRLEGGVRALVLWSAAIVALGALSMEGAGALVSLGVKVALIPS